MPACGICTAPNTYELEELGARAQREEISWRQAARDGGLKYHQPLKAHMENHVLQREEKVARNELSEMVEAAIRDLTQEMVTAPAVAKPLYLVAIENLKNLSDTKPSQQHLIQALKTIQELNGMKQEQRLMLQFAEAMFKQVEPAPERKALGVEVIDAEVVE